MRFIGKMYRGVAIGAEGVQWAKHFTGAMGWYELNWMEWNDNQ